MAASTDGRERIPKEMVSAIITRGELIGSRGSRPQDYTYSFQLAYKIINYKTAEYSMSVWIKCF
jgi:hypothetical protein